MAHPVVPHMVMADAQGNIFDDPDLLMVCRRGGEWGLPRPDELMPLPEESELWCEVVHPDVIRAIGPARAVKAALIQQARPHVQAVFPSG